METFSFNLPINSVEEGKWLLVVTCFETTYSNFNITNENSSFSVTILGHWGSKSSENTIDEPFNLLQFRSENDIKLHVEQFRKKAEYF